MAYTSTTLTQLQAALAARYEGQVFWTADQARRAINEGLRIWSLITGTWRVPITITTIPDDPHLYVSGILVKAAQVSIGGRILTPTSLVALDRTIADWELVNTGAGTPTPSQVVYWAPVGITEIMIYPMDAPPGQTDVLVDGITRAPILVSGGDYLDLGDEEISTLLGYALHVVSIGKGIEALETTRPLRAAFLRAAMARNAVFAGSSNYRKIIGLDRNTFQQPVRNATADEAGVLLVGAVTGEAEDRAPDGPMSSRSKG